METIVISLEAFKKNQEIAFRDFLLLAAHILNLPYHKIFFCKQLEFNGEQYELFVKMIQKRENGCPIAKIIGSKEFYGLDFITNESTLDPRPETEIVIDMVKKYFPDCNGTYKILDLGCGTGCLSLTLLTMYHNVTATLVDVSPKALNVAVKNAEKYKLEGRCKFLISDWFNNVFGQYDIIVSNPPYVPIDYKLDKQTSYDPQIALFAGEEGLDAYKKIIPSCSNYLKQNGMIFVEIGQGQLDKVKNLFAKNVQFIGIQNDLAGIDRVLTAKKDV